MNHQKKLKIAIILYQMLVSGGTERQAVMFGKYLRRLGHDVVFYAFSYDKESCYPKDLEGVEVAHMGGEKGPRNFLAKKLASKIDKDTDVLNPHEQIALRVAYYFRREVKNIPSVLMLNDLFLSKWSLSLELNPRRFSLAKKNAWD